MQVVVDLPEAMIRRFLDGQDISARVREALAMDDYLSGRMSRGQVAEVLGMSFYEAEQWFVRRGIHRDYSIEDLEEDRKTLDRILSIP
jgi:predicted HTH domain antitoxin